jgi:hypothetical protein
MVSYVMETMLALRCELVAGPVPHDQLVALSWRAARLPIAGRRPLTIALSSDQRGCLSLSAALFACETAAVDGEMIDDTLRELVNMIGGQVRTAVVEEHSMGLPTIDTDVQLEAGLELDAPLLIGRCVVLRTGAFEIVVHVTETPEINQAQSVQPGVSPAP